MKRIIGYRSYDSKEALERIVSPWSMGRTSHSLTAYRFKRDGTTFDDSTDITFTIVVIDKFSNAIYDCNLPRKKRPVTLNEACLIMNRNILKGNKTNLFNCLFGYTYILPFITSVPGFHHYIMV